MPSEDPALREALIKKAEAALHDGRFFHGRVTNGDLRLAIEHGIDAALSATPTPAPVCVGCEGHPAPENNPCAVCGREAPTPAPIDNEADERKAFEEWAIVNWPNSNPPDNAWIGWQARATMGAPIDNDALVEAICVEIKRWTETQFPKTCRVGSGVWIGGLANRIARAVLALPSIATCKPPLQVQDGAHRPHDAAPPVSDAPALVEGAIGALEEIERRTGLLIHQNTGRWNMRVEADKRTVDVLTVNQEISQSALAKLKEGRA